MKIRVIFIYSLLLLLILIETINILKINSSETDNTLEIKIPSLRGSIYDCNDNLIATSVPHYVAYLDVDFLNRFYNPSMEIDLKLLESRFNIKIDREKRFIKIGEANDIDEIRNRIPTNLRKFVNISIVQKRISLSDFGMDLIIGNIHNQNYSGIEKVFNEYLKEKSDGKIVFKFSGNISKKGNITNIIPPKNGNNLKLTIDSLLQKNYMN